MSILSRINTMREYMKKYNTIRIKINENDNPIICFVKYPANNQWYNVTLDEKTGEGEINGVARPDIIAEMMVEYADKGYVVQAVDSSIFDADKMNGKRTCAPKKNLADTFDKNFRKML